MAVQQELWDTGEAEKYAKWMKVGSRIFYAPFAGRIVQHLPSMEGGPTIVDLGTGPGLLSIELCKLLPHVWIIGVDPSLKMLDIARKNAEDVGISNYETRSGRAEEMPVESNSVDLVVTQSSLHEWDSPQKAFSEIFRVLRPGGALILKDYNRKWLSGWKRNLFKIFHHLHMFKFTFDDVVDLLREAGFDELSGEERGLQFFVQAVKRGNIDSDEGREAPTGTTRCT
jgi:ubiquinone/menaquinone biosynthesis C-methylase UbiE